MVAKRFIKELSRSERLGRIAPGLPSLLEYQFSRDFMHDLVAGISVAAVALPVAVAYAQLAGFNPVVRRSAVFTAKNEGLVVSQSPQGHTFATLNSNVYIYVDERPPKPSPSPSPTPSKSKSKSPSPSPTPSDTGTSSPGQ